MEHTLTWLFMFVATGQTGTMEAAKPFPTEEACVASVEKYKDRMGDFIKGHFNVHLDEEILVNGVCSPSGKPA